MVCRRPGWTANVTGFGFAGGPFGDQPAVGKAAVAGAGNGAIGRPYPQGGEPGATGPDLTVTDLAHGPGVHASHARRVDPVLGKAAVVDDVGLRGDEATGPPSEPLLRLMPRGSGRDSCCDAEQTQPTGDRASPTSSRKPAPCGSFCGRDGGSSSVTAPGPAHRTEEYQRDIPPHQPNVVTAVSFTFESCELMYGHYAGER